MFDLDWGKLALIGAIALIVIGPKDLPKALRMAGFWLRKARAMASEFQSSVEQMAREAELQELREKVEKASRMDVEGEIRKTVDPDNKIADAFAPPVFDDPAAIIAAPTPTPTSPSQPSEPAIAGVDHPAALPAVTEIPMTSATPTIAVDAIPAAPLVEPVSEPVAPSAPKQV
jgi:sec-independent protein translocase protein TatB